MSDTSKNCNCSRCGKRIVLGINGVVIDTSKVCDKCAGVKRDKNGFAWLPEDINKIGDKFAKDIFIDE